MPDSTTSRALGSYEPEVCVGLLDFCQLKIEIVALCAALITKLSKYA